MMSVMRPPVHLFWLLDCSGSMSGPPITSLNAAIRAAIPELQRGFEEHVPAQLMIRVVTFSGGAQWHVRAPTPIEEFQWSDVTASGVVDLGAALRLVARELETPPMPSQALRPVIVVVSDGLPTDDWRAGLHAVNNTPWGKRALRLAIAMGSDTDNEILKKFVADPKLEPFQVRNRLELTGAIRWVCTTIIEAFSVSRNSGTPVPNLNTIGDDSVVESSPRVAVSSGQGVQVGDQNVQFNQFIQTYVSDQVAGALEPQPHAAAGLRIFVSYSHRDERYREKLEISLAQLRRDDLISTWHDKKILPGEEWDREIDDNLNNADMVLLLISPDFLASDYAYGREMERALERHRSRSAIVVPIILRPSDWLNSRLASLQALPSRGRPISSWPNRDVAWLDVVQGLRKIISS
jgi:uncharacterized protein YegL